MEQKGNNSEEINSSLSAESLNEENVVEEESSYAEPEKLYEENIQEQHGDDDAVTVRPIQFASFDNLSSLQGEENQNLDLLMDIKLKITVELGRCELPIKKVLELTRGSIVELDKVAGEPVGLFANGELIALGEVVVIEDNFGLRVISVVTPEERLKNL